MKKDVNGMLVQDYLLGSASVNMWIAILILANITVFIMMGNRVNKGIKTNENTPDKFHIGYFLTHNILDILRTEFSIYILSRLSLLWVESVYVVAFSVFIGLISDQIIVIFSFVKDQGIGRIKRQVIKIFGKDKDGNTEIKTEVTEKKTE